MVFHDQQEDVQSAISKLNLELSYLNLDNLCIEEKHISDVVEATGRLSRQISGFIRGHYEDFPAFDNVKIYYDNGQVEVSRILSSVFNALLPNLIFRKVMPSEYKLFQAADLLCTLELVKLKLENNMFSKSEKIFFGNIRDLNENYLVSAH